MAVGVAVQSAVGGGRSRERGSVGLVNQGRGLQFGDGLLWSWVSLVFLLVEAVEAIEGTRRSMTIDHFLV